MKTYEELVAEARLQLDLEIPPFDVVENMRFIECQYEGCGETILSDGRAGAVRHMQRVHRL